MASAPDGSPLPADACLPGGPEARLHGPVPTAALMMLSLPSLLPASKAAPPLQPSRKAPVLPPGNPRVLRNRKHPVICARLGRRFAHRHPLAFECLLMRHSSECAGPWDGRLRHTEVYPRSLGPALSTQGGHGAHELNKLRLKEGRGHWAAPGKSAVPGTGLSRGSPLSFACPCLC